MSEQTIVLSIDSSGNVKTIYTDGGLELYEALGPHTVKRASHVEPDGNDWIVDLTPIGGPVLPIRYKHREQALKAEENWIKENYL